MYFLFSFLDIEATSKLLWLCFIVNSDIIIIIIIIIIMQRLTRHVSG